MSKFKFGDRVQPVGYTGYTGVVLCASTREELVEVIMESLGILHYRPESLELIEDQSKEPEEYEYYKYSYKGIKLDPYRILDIYKITCPAQQHAIKKLLVTGGRGYKDRQTDIQNAIDTLNRLLELESE